MKNNNLKEVLVIVRPEKAKATEQLLLRHGAEYVARQTVSGRGKEMGQTFRRSWFGFKSRSFSYLRKTMLSALVEVRHLETLLNTIVEENKTGNFGDGRVFILSTI